MKKKQCDPRLDQISTGRLWGLQELSPYVDAHHPPTPLLLTSSCRIFKRDGRARPLGIDGFGARRAIRMVRRAPTEFRGQRPLNAAINLLPSNQVIVDQVHSTIAKLMANDAQPLLLIIFWGVDRIFSNF